MGENNTSTALKGCGVKICIELLHFSLKWELPNLYHFAVEAGGLINFPSGRLAALKSCSNLSRASFKVGLTGSMAQGPLGLSSCC